MYGAICSSSESDIGSLGLNVNYMLTVAFYSIKTYTWIGACSVGCKLVDAMNHHPNTP